MAPYFIGNVLFLVLFLHLWYNMHKGNCRHK